LSLSQWFLGSRKCENVPCKSEWYGSLGDRSKARKRRSRHSTLRTPTRTILNIGIIRSPRLPGRIPNPTFRKRLGDFCGGEYDERLSLEALCHFGRVICDGWVCSGKRHVMNDSRWWVFLLSLAYTAESSYEVVQRPNRANGRWDMFLHTTRQLAHGRTKRFDSTHNINHSGMPLVLRHSAQFIHPALFTARPSFTSNFVSTSRADPSRRGL
jgi:hypothetical protein